MQKPIPHKLKIRTSLQPGDIGYIIYMHGKIYSAEYGYAISFESYVAGGLHEFFMHYDGNRDGVWIVEHEGSIIASVFLVHRTEKSAQLRYFLIAQQYRKMGLGKMLMDLFMDFLKQKGYDHAYLWTTNEQIEAGALYRKTGFMLTQERSSSSFGKALIEQRYDWKRRE